MPQPKVSTGARSADLMAEIPRTTRTADDHLQAAAERSKTAFRGRRFYSPHGNFRVSLWAVPDRTVDGSLIQGISKSAQFVDHWYLLREPEEENYGDAEAYDAARKEYEREVRILTSKASYGDGRSFWDADKMAVKAKQAQIAAARDQVKALLADPDTAGMLREELTAEQFVYLGAQEPEPEPKVVAAPPKPRGRPRRRRQETVAAE